MVLQQPGLGPTRPAQKLEGGQGLNDVHLLPKDLDKQVAALHLLHLDAELMNLSKEQADYIGVK